MRKTHQLAAVVTGCILALSGCGGDDDDSGSAVALTAITEANAAAVSAVVFQAASVLFDVASSSAALPLGAVAQTTSGRSSDGLGLVSFSARQLKVMMQRPLPSASGAVGAVYQETFQCAGGGTVTERMDDADNNGVESVGDSLRLSFANCVEEGITSNGVVSFKLTVLSGATTGAQVTFGDLLLNDGTDVIGANGGFDLTLTETPNVSARYEIAGNSLTGSVNGDRHTLTAFTGTAATDYVVGAVTYTFAGGVSDSSNNIAVDAETVNAFVGRLADDFPGSGTLRSTGAAKSQALLEAVSSTRVRVSADPEGDGSFTTPVDWSWSELEALAD